MASFNTKKTAIQNKAAAESAAEEVLASLGEALSAYNSESDEEQKAVKLTALKNAYADTLSAVDAYTNAGYNDAESALEGYTSIASVKTAMVAADKAKLTAAALAFSVEKNDDEDAAKTAVETVANALEGLCFTDWKVSGNITGFNSGSAGEVTVSLTLASRKAGDNTGSIADITMTVTGE